MEFTYHQKISMLKILLDIINADSRILACEIALFNQLKDQLSLEDSDLGVVQAKNSLLALLQIKEMEKNQKSYFAKIMGSMIAVDDDINVNEIAIFNVVRDYCGIAESLEEAIGEHFNECSLS